MQSDPERLQQALGLAYRYLGKRERATDETRRHLEQKGIESSVAEEAICILGEDGYLDDARFARLFVQDKRELEQWGSERIRQGLRAKGLARELIDSALASEDAAQDQSQSEGELHRALALLVRRFPSPPRERRERDRALGVLIRKGYDPDLALDALSTYARGGESGGLIGT